MVEIKIMQDLVNRRYYVGYNTMFEFKHYNGEAIIRDAPYNICCDDEIFDREVIDCINRSEMTYEAGQYYWYNDIPYRIDKVSCDNEEYKIYLKKQRIVEEIGKDKAEELLKYIKAQQKSILKEKQEQREREKRSFLYKIKTIFKKNRRMIYW